MRTLKMYEVLDLLKVVDKKISELDKRTPTVESNDVNNYRQLLSSQRVLLKLAKDKGNNSKPLLYLFGETNSYRIYVSSEIRLELDKFKDDSKKNSSKYKLLAKRLADIDKRMEIFNKTKTVKVTIYSDLQLKK